ncbi:hypothetical protein JKP88DRAFT_288580 [Tribonema minus]|uniref:Uncharacterized protein n=1 Tax=Tribonema minus TaxID=303371 RepID=A0A836CI06_9STRA|nr:hypothetical protein JKP88DRAFT_288580 [Tribonema minus]
MSFLFVGELDIMEHINDQMAAYTTVHYATDSAGDHAMQSAGIAVNWPQGTFLKFAIERARDHRMAFYVGDQEILAPVPWANAFYGDPNPLLKPFDQKAAPWTIPSTGPLDISAPFYDEGSCSFERPLNVKYLGNAPELRGNSGLSVQVIPNSKAKFEAYLAPFGNGGGSRADYTVDFGAADTNFSIEVVVSDAQPGSTVSILLDSTKCHSNIAAVHAQGGELLIAATSLQQGSELCRYGSNLTVLGGTPPWCWPLGTPSDTAAATDPGPAANFGPAADPRPAADTGPATDPGPAADTGPAADPGSATDSGPAADTRPATTSADGPEL